jgi:hypothetical protein
VVCKEGYNKFSFSFNVFFFVSVILRLVKAQLVYDFVKDMAKLDGTLF